jgi:hypothetical protein
MSQKTKLWNDIYNATFLMKLYEDDRNSSRVPERTIAFVKQW